MAARFKPDKRLAQRLAHQREVKDALRPFAERVKAEAEHASPIGESGDYISFFVITETPTKLRVGNTDFAAHLVEWGSVNNPPYAPLRRGARAAGLRLDEHPPPGDLDA